MKGFVCTSCGSTEYREQDGYRICEYCGTKFVPEADEKAKKPSSIGLNSDVERLLQKCRENPRKAAKYANLVLDIDPTNQEAQQYL